MQKTILMTIGGLLATALMIGALFTWFNLSDRVLSSNHPQTMVWATRMLAIAAGALAQVIVLWLVVGRMYSDRTFNLGLRIIASCVGCIALIVAAALGLASRG